jgi:hypothetical protein
MDLACWPFDPSGMLHSSLWFGGYVIATESRVVSVVHVLQYMLQNFLNS